jgi:hypothetical protein
MLFLLRIGLVVIAASFGLLALFGLLRFSIEVGGSPVRYLIQDVGLFLVGVAGLSGSIWCWRRLDARERALFVDPPPFTDDRFEASVKQPLRAMILVLFVALSLLSLSWLLREPGFKAAAVTAVMSGAVVLMGLMAASMHRGTRPSQLHMDTRGLTHPWYGHIPWTAVHGMNFQETRGRAGWIFTMVLGVGSPDRFLIRMPWIVRVMQGRWLTGGQPTGAISIPLNPLDKPPREIYAAAWALRHRVQPGLIYSWQAPIVF